MADNRADNGSSPIIGASNIIKNSNTHSNLDYYYGPWEVTGVSEDNVGTNILSTLKDIYKFNPDEGFTCGVILNDGPVAEYWLQNGEMVKKTGGSTGTAQVSNVYKYKNSDWISTKQKAINNNSLLKVKSANISGGSIESVTAIPSNIFSDLDTEQSVSFLQGQNGSNEIEQQVFAGTGTGSYRITCQNKFIVESQDEAQYLTRNVVITPEDDAAAPMLRAYFPDTDDSTRLFSRGTLCIEAQDKIQLGFPDSQGNTEWALNVEPGKITAPAIYQTSDVRLKEDIQFINLTEEQLRAFHGVKFKFKNDVPKEYVGVIAQEIQRIWPDLVSEDSNGYLSVDYSKFGVLALEYIQQQQKQINNLNQELTALKEYVYGERRNSK